MERRLSNTNAAFRLLAVTRADDSPHEYDTRRYEATRKVKRFRLKAFGFRPIVAGFNLPQVEVIPALGVTSALDSLLF